MEFGGIVTVILLYFVLPLALLLGIMYLIRRRNDKEAGRKPSQKIDSIKAEERKGEKKV